MNTERFLRWGDALVHRCAPVLARATAKTCALAFACAGEGRVVAWWLQLLRTAELLSSDFFRRYRAGFARGVTCSSHGTTEHEWFLNDRSLDATTRARAARDAASRGIRVSPPGCREIGRARAC